MGRQIRTVVSRIMPILIRVGIRIFAVNPGGRLQTMGQDISKYKANSKRQREEKAGNLGLWICVDLVQVENPPYLLFSAALPNLVWAFARFGDGTYPPMARVITTNQDQRSRAWLGKHARFDRIQQTTEYCKKPQQITVRHDLQTEILAFCRSKNVGQEFWRRLVEQEVDRKIQILVCTQMYTYLRTKYKFGIVSSKCTCTRLVRSLMDDVQSWKPSALYVIVNTIQILCEVEFIILVRTARREREGLAMRKRQRETTGGPESGMSLPSSMSPSYWTAAEISWR